MRAVAGLVAVALVTPAAANAAPRRHTKTQPSAASSTAGTNPNGTALPPPSNPGVETTHKEGDYSGVEPDRAQEADPNAKPKPKRPPPKGTLSWIGFELKDGGSEIFFQSPGAFDLAQHVEGSTLVVELGSLTALGANTWRPIDTRFFDQPVARIEAHRVGAAGATKGAPAHRAGIEVRITFKNPADAKEGAYRSSQETDGYYYAYLAFAGGGAAASDGSATVGTPEQ